MAILADSHLPIQLLVCADDGQQSVQSMVSELKQEAYNVVHQQTLLDKLPSPHPDVVLLDNLHYLTDQHIWTKQPPSERPILVLLLEDEPDSQVPDCIDVVLSPRSVNFYRNLKTIVRLATQNDHLQAQVETQERLNTEVEILKNAIVRNVSHELKTPLLQVKSAVALLAEDVDDEKLITYAKGATARLETLVKNITLLGSGLDHNPAPVIVRDALEYAKRNLGRIWEHRDSRDRINVALDDSLPPVMADKQGLSTVLQLLMDNALKFSQADIHVTANSKDDLVAVKVQDHGIGIAQADIDSIFETFYQVDSSSTRRYGGTGVGLAIAQFILDNHGTKITVASEIGQGSTFAFELPVASVS